MDTSFTGVVLGSLETLGGLRGGGARIIPPPLWIWGEDGWVELPLVAEGPGDILRQPFLKSNHSTNYLGNGIEGDTLSSRQDLRVQPWLLPTSTAAFVGPFPVRIS